MALAVAPVPLRRVRGLLASPQLTRNALLLGANLGAGFCGYLLHAVLGRLLGPASYGNVAALIALSSVLLFPTQVIATVVAKDVAILEATGVAGQIHDRVRRLTRILVPPGLVVAFLVLAAGHPIARFLHLGAVGPVIMLGGTFAVAVAAPINLGVFQGRQQYGAYAAFLVVPVALRVILSCGLVLLGFGVTGAMLGVTLSVIVSYLLSFAPLRPVLAGPRVPSGSLTALASSTATTLIALGSTVVLYNLDTLLAKHLMADAPAGMYAALATVGKSVLVVSNAIVMVAFPRFATLHARRGRPGLAVLGAVLGTVALALAVETPFVLAPALTMRLLVGPSFAPVAGQLGWYGLAMLLFAVAQVFIYYFLACGQRLFAAPIVVCCLLQVILFSLWHDTVAHLVIALVLSKALLALALGGLFVHRMKER